MEELSISTQFRQTHLIVVSAPSGAGKTTLCQKLLKDFPSLQLSISFTTRAPRGSEQEGVEYFFLSQEDFQRKIAQNELAEWAYVHGNYYGTSKNRIEEAFRSNQSVLLDIDVQGAKQLLKSYPKEAFLVFIAPPSLEILESRLRARGTDSEETIQKRLKNAKIEMSEKDDFHVVILNDSMDRAYQEFKNLLKTKLHLEPRGGSIGKAANSEPGDNL